MIDTTDAEIISRALDTALGMSGPWPQIKDALTGAGYTPAEIATAFQHLADGSGHDPLVTEEDF